MTNPGSARPRRRGGCRDGRLPSRGGGGGGGPLSRRFLPTPSKIIHRSAGRETRRRRRAGGGWGAEGRAAFAGFQRPRRAQGRPGCPGGAEPPAHISEVSGERRAVGRDRGKIASEWVWGTHCHEGFNKRAINEAAEGAAGLLEGAGAREGRATPKAFPGSQAGGGDLGGQRQWQQRHLEGSRGCPRGVPTQRHSAAGGAGMAVPSTQWWFWDGAESRVLPPGDASPAPSPPPPPLP